MSAKAGGDAMLGYFGCLGQTGTSRDVELLLYLSVHFPMDVLLRADYRERNPTLEAKENPKIIKNADKHFKSVRWKHEMNELRAKIKAWDLNKEVYPRDSLLEDEQLEFFVSAGEKGHRQYIVDSGASCHLI